MTFKVPEIKLVKSYRFNRKNTAMKWHCVGQSLLFISEKQLRYNKLDYLVLNKADEFLLFVKLYFSSTFNYTQLNYNNLIIPVSCSAIVTSLPLRKR